jgi:hypothetical protein
MAALILSPARLDGQRLDQSDQSRCANRPSVHYTSAVRGGLRVVFPVALLVEDVVGSGRGAGAAKPGVELVEASLSDIKDTP